MKVDSIPVLEHRQSEAEADPLFVRRWSPRAMSGEAVSQGELEQLFEAARWAPSAFNRQPWRFLYAHRDSEHWPRFFDLLVEFNQGWAHRAGALLVVVSRTVSDSGNPIHTHSYDTGAAWQSLALQGSLMGLVVHGMAGFDKEAARRELAVPDDWEVEAMAAVGRPGEVDELPESLRQKEKPSGRKSLAEVAVEGPFA